MTTPAATGARDQVDREAFDELGDDRGVLAVDLPGAGLRGGPDGHADGLDEHGVRHELAVRADDGGLGHEAGAALLINLAQRLTHALADGAAAFGRHRARPG